MDLSFTEVSFDGELSDLGEDELRQLVSEFMDAQESNVAEFEKAAEEIENYDGLDVEGFTEARQALIEDITEAEDFEDVPVTEDQLEESDFSELQDWREFIASDDSGESESDDQDGDFGKKSPSLNGEDETEEFIEDELSSMQGLNLG